MTRCTTTRRATVFVLPALFAAAALAQQPMAHPPDVPFVPSPQDIVEHMLKLANVHHGDVVYDLGCGDGRIVIAAAKMGASRAVGVDINPERIAEATKNARAAGVLDHVKFIQGDLFTVPIHDASVVTLYLLPSVNVKLKPRLMSQLRPGTRVVSHSFDMGDWKPDKTEEVQGRYLYYWVIPKH